MLRNSPPGSSALRISSWLFLLAVLVLPGFAEGATTGQRFDLDYASGQRAASNPATAREALPAYQRLGEDAVRRGQFAEAAIAYSNAAVSARALGRLQDALRLSQKAAEAAGRSGKAEHQAVALDLLGEIHLGLGMPEKAIPLFEQAVQAARQATNPRLEANGHSGLSKAYRRLGNLPQALAHGQKAAETLHNLLQMRSVDWNRSAEGRRRLQVLEGNYADSLAWDVGQIHLALRQWQPARDAFEKVLAIGTRLQFRRVVMMGRWGLGTVAVQQGDFAAAAAHLEDALRQSPPPSLLGRIESTLGRAYRGMGKLPEAETALRRAMAQVEDLRDLLQSEELRESFFEDKIGIYEGLVLVLLGQGKAEEAFDVGERARARAFLDLLGNRVTLSRGRDQALVAEEQALRQRIHALRSQPEESPTLRRDVEAARQAYQAFLERVRQADREHASLMTVEPLRLAQVQALLPEGTLLLEYFVTEQDRTVLWVVDRHSATARTIPLGRAAVAKMVHEFRDLIASRDRQADFERVAQRLYAQLVRPGLAGRQPRELLIVPHDALHYLPFQSLMSGPGRYLLQDVPLYYSSSASLIQFTRAKAQGGPPSFFALGNPDFQDLTLSLRYAKREAQGITGLFPGSTLVTGPGATKAALRDATKTHTILHLATHAEFDEADPLGSALLLAGPPGGENRLEVQEVFGLDLQASLVVLSACETGLGKLSRGDEVTGMLRAFIYAGAPSVITTLWQVNDRASYELMEQFYQNLKGGANKAEALRTAQLAIMQKYPQPYYWAAYQLTGEPR